MAFIQIKKYKRAELKNGGMFVHFDDEKREKLNHSNEDIDKSLTHLNYTLDCVNYKDVLEKAEKRNKEIDKIQPPKRLKKDRVELISFWVVCPLEIEDKADKFFEITNEFLKNYCGSENYYGSFIHKDEKHIYLENHTKKESLYHLHAFASPITEEKGLNCKSFMTRQRLTELQKQFCDLVRNEFGIEYQTGEYAGRKTAPKKTVEQKKLRSAKENLQLAKLVQIKANQTLKLQNGIKQQQEQLKADMDELQRQKDYIMQLQINLNQQIEKMERKKREYEKKLYEWQGASDSLKTKQTIAHLQNSLEKANTKLEHIREHYPQIYNELDKHKSQKIDKNI